MHSPFNWTPLSIYPEMEHFSPPPSPTAQTTDAPVPGKSPGAPVNTVIPGAPLMTATPPVTPQASPAPPETTEDPMEEETEEEDVPSEAVPETDEPDESPEPQESSKKKKPELSTEMVWTLTGVAFVLIAIAVIIYFFHRDRNYQYAYNPSKAARKRRKKQPRSRPKSKFISDPNPFIEDSDDSDDDILRLETDEEMKNILRESQELQERLSEALGARKEPEITRQELYKLYDEDYDPGDPNLPSSDEESEIAGLSAGIIS